MQIMVHLNALNVMKNVHYAQALIQRHNAMHVLQDFLKVPQSLVVLPIVAPLNIKIMAPINVFLAILVCSSIIDQITLKF